MRKVEFKEQIVQNEERITFTGDNVVGVTIKNQGTNNVVTLFGDSESAINEILPQASESYGVPGYILEGSLKITFSGVGTSKAIVKIAYDKGEICD